MVHQMDINLGLAAAGDAVQQEASVAARLRDGIHRLLLRDGQRVRVIEVKFRSARRGALG